MSKCNKTEDDEEYSKVIKMKMMMIMVVMMVMVMMMVMVITTSRSTQKNAMANMKISIHNMILQGNMKIVEYTIQFSGILSKS